MSAPAAHAALEVSLRAAHAYLAVLVGREPGALLELRARRDAGGMIQRFYPNRNLRGAAEAITALGRQRDVYVGAVPRRRRGGGLDALASAWVLWVDCDGPAAVACLAEFSPAPSIVVRSGSGENRHAYWPLLRAATPAQATAANRRLAHALGADLASAEAARILRPPGTRNFKHHPPAAVTIERLRPRRRFTARELVGELPDPPAAAGAGAPRRDPGPALSGEDPLRQIPPRVYVELLTGRRVGRDGKASCPFHADATPSLHAYREPERGWYCYGCRRGGSIYDLAAQLYGLSPRGRDFAELRRRLHAALGDTPRLTRTEQPR